MTAQTSGEGNENHSPRHFTEEESVALKKLQHILDAGEPESFSKKEIETIRKMIDLYAAFVTFGRIGRGVRNVIIMVGFFAATWIAFNDWIIKIIKSAATGQ